MYGLLISIGGILAFLISENIAKKRTLDLKLFYLATNAAIIGGVVGARLYHVIDYWDFYKDNVWQIFEVWKGGLGILGGLIGGGASVTAVLIWNKQKLLPWLDVLVLGIPLAQTIGRWGNFFNQELYGIETSLPWGLNIEGRKYHPMFLYESFLNLLLFLFMLKKTKTYNPSGNIFYIYITGYGVIRFIMEFFKANVWTIGCINIAQFISLLFIMCGLILLWRNRSFKRNL